MGTINDFERDNEGGLEEIVRGTAMEHGNAGIVGTGGKEGEGGGKVDSADGFGVVAEDFVGFVTHVEIEPEGLLIVAADEKMIATGVNGQRGDPLTAGSEFLEETALDEIVNANVTLSGDEERRLGRMEGTCLDLQWRLAERCLGLGRTQLVDQQPASVGSGANSCKVVSFGVEDTFTDGFTMHHINAVNDGGIGGTANDLPFAQFPVACSAPGRSHDRRNFLEQFDTGGTALLDNAGCKNGDSSSMDGNRKKRTRTDIALR
jgi:hypothetical protein